MRGIRFAVTASALVMSCLATQAVAGPPFTTDDPEPTELGHWEVYAPLIELEGGAGDLSGAAGIEVNFGAGSQLQLTAAVPLAFELEEGQWRTGAGDLEVGAKYRFLLDEENGFQAAVFPALTLPTAKSGFGAGKVTAFLPVWGQLDRGPWSIFGGGGYTINAGTGAKDFWSGGLAVTRDFGDALTLGIEADRQGADGAGERASTSLGVGTSASLAGPLRLAISAGPRFEDGGSTTEFHAFFALGIEY